MTRNIKHRVLFFISLIVFTTCKKEDVPITTGRNSPPVVNAGPDRQVLLPDNFTALNGSATDPDGNIVSYRWTKISGPSTYALVTPDNVVTIVNQLVEGVYQFELNVADNGGLSANDTVIVTVNAAGNINQPPLAYAGVDQIIILPLDSLELRGIATDTDGTIVSYNWIIHGYLSQSGQYIDFYYNTAAVRMNNLAEGIYSCTFQVLDDKGASATDVTIVRVVSVNCPCHPDPCDSLGDPCDPWDY